MSKVVKPLKPSKAQKEHWKKLEKLNPFIKRIEEECKPEQAINYIRLIEMLSNEIMHSSIGEAKKLNISTIPVKETKAGDDINYIKQQKAFEILKESEMSVGNILEVLEYYSKILNNFTNAKLYKELTYKEILPKNAINLD